MDKVKVRRLREDINEALAQVGQRHGATISTGSAQYDAQSVTFTLNIVEQAEDGSEQTIEAIDFLRVHARYGLMKKHLGTTFGHGTRTYKIIGSKPRNTKYPIIVLDVASGNRFKFRADCVRKYLGLVQ